MAILEMRLLPDPILRKQAKKVAKVTPQLKVLVDDMVETMRDQHGVGLAANQVGSLQKVAVIETPEMEKPLVLINPEVMKTEGERQVEEGCLSVPGYRGMVNRSETVRVKAMGLDGKTFYTLKFRSMRQDGKIYRLNADALLAQALEHEIDHLNGILYIDHLVSHESLYKITYHDHDESDGDCEDSVVAEPSAAANED